MLATVYSAALQGVEAAPVQVEVNYGESGRPELVLVGLPDAAVKESQDRVCSALVNSGFRPPRARTTINLAPGGLRKEGPLYDLPIALGLLQASGQMASASMGGFLVAGELSLSGATRPARGVLAFSILAKRLGRRGVVVPRVCAAEAALVEGVQVYGVDSLSEAFRFLSGDLHLMPHPQVRPEDLPSTPVEAAMDLSEVRGQFAVRRAVEVAVAGEHNLLLVGPPGSGKSMVARRIPSIMPPPTLEEYLEILSIHSAAGFTLDGRWARWRRPYRSPHHTISDVGLIGGGSVPGPGEISLAHRGVLFLDELPEFKRSALETLRQPLEDGEVQLSRSAGKVTLPCQFMLVAAMNPCPCGHLGDSRRECRCSPGQIERYRARVSGPLLDRIDLQVEAPCLSIEDLRGNREGEASEAVRGRIAAARSIQRHRFAGTCTASNARMGQAQVRRWVQLDRAQGDLLQAAMERLALSARAYDRVLKVARTIADLAGSDAVAAEHLMEAIQYRGLDRRTNL